MMSKTFSQQKCSIFIQTLYDFYRLNLYKSVPIKNEIELKGKFLYLEKTVSNLSTCNFYGLCRKDAKYVNDMALNKSDHG